MTTSTIVVRPDGRPVLTDLRGASWAAPADAEADLRRLVADRARPAAGRGRAPRLRPGRRGQPARGAGRAAARARARRRTSVVDACYATAEPEPRPAPGRGCPGVLGAGGRAPAGRTPRRGAADGCGRTRRRRRPRSGSRRPSWRSPSAVLAAGVGLDRRAPAPIAAARARRPTTRCAAAVELSRLRAAVMRDGGRRPRSTTVEVADGPAHSGGRAAARGLAAQRVDGLTVDVQDAWLVEDDGSRGAHDGRRRDVRDVRALPVPADGGARSGWPPPRRGRSSWACGGPTTAGASGTCVERLTSVAPRRPSAAAVARSAWTGTKPLASSTAGTARIDPSTSDEKSPSTAPQREGGHRDDRGSVHRAGRARRPPRRCAPGAVTRLTGPCTGRGQQVLDRPGPRPAA